MNCDCGHEIYSIRVYEFLKQYLSIGKRKMTIEDIRHKLQMGKKYPNYAQLKQRVILPAQKELAEKTDISFEFTELKTGKSVTALEFSIVKNNVNRAIDGKRIFVCGNCGREWTETKTKGGNNAF